MLAGKKLTGSCAAASLWPVKAQWRGARVLPMANIACFSCTDSGGLRGRSSQAAVSQARAFRCDTTPQARLSRSVMRSRGSTSPSQVDATPASSASRLLLSSESTWRIPGTTCSACTDWNGGKYVSYARTAASIETRSYVWACIRVECIQLIVLIAVVPQRPTSLSPKRQCNAVYVYNDSCHILASCGSIWRSSTAG